MSGMNALNAYINKVERISSLVEKAISVSVSEVVNITTPVVNNNLKKGVVPVASSSKTSRKVVQAPDSTVNDAAAKLKDEIEALNKKLKTEGQRRSRFKRNLQETEKEIQTSYDKVNFNKKIIERLKIHYVNKLSGIVTPDLPLKPTSHSGATRPLMDPDEPFVAGPGFEVSSEFAVPPYVSAKSDNLELSVHSTTIPALFQGAEGKTFRAPKRLPPLSVKRLELNPSSSPPSKGKRKYVLKNPRVKKGQMETSVKNVDKRKRGGQKKQDTEKKGTLVKKEKTKPDKKERTKTSTPIKRQKRSASDVEVPKAKVMRTNSRRSCREERQTRSGMSN